MNCPRCAYSYPSDDRFCGNCGAPLPSALPPPAGALLPELEAHLAILVSHDIVYERARIPELEYIFRHALLQEDGYHSLLNAQRRDTHRRAALALEQLYPARLDDLVPLPAHYCYAAEAQALLLESGAVLA